MGQTELEHCGLWFPGVKGWLLSSEDNSWIFQLTSSSTQMIWSLKVSISKLTSLGERATSTINILLAIHIMLAFFDMIVRKSAQNVEDK